MQRHPRDQTDRSSMHINPEDCPQERSMRREEPMLHTCPNSSNKLNYIPSINASDATTPKIRQNPLRINDSILEQRSARLLVSASTKLWTGQNVCLHESKIQQAFKNAPLISPIERDSLLQLDAQRLTRHLQIQYDINHERYVTFRSTMDQRRCCDAEYYFSAISFEVIAHMSGALIRESCICSKSSSNAIDVDQQRLLIFFDTLRNVIRSLIRTEHWIFVDQALDIEMLMSQLKTGQCDLLSLALWIGKILKQSCSPMRDSLVDDTMGILTSAMQNSNGHQLAQGLSSLFDVLGTMKLDVINYQMRTLLPPLVDDSLEFVAQEYRQQIEKKAFDYQHLWRWFHQEREIRDAKAACADLEFEHEGAGGFNDQDVTWEDEDFLTRYIEIVFEEVLVNKTPVHLLPKSFELDHRRIYEIRGHFEKLLQQRCQLETLSYIMEECGAAHQLSALAEREVLQRLEDVQSQSTQGPELFESLALEIVRTAYNLVGRSSSLPEDEHVVLARDFLDTSKTTGMNMAMGVQEQLRDFVEAQLFEEISGTNGISDLPSSQILDRYKPLNRRVLGSELMDESCDRIRFIAQSLAHMTLTQWRVWADLLWFKPGEVIFSSPEEYQAWKAGVAQAVQARFPLYRKLKTRR